MPRSRGCNAFELDALRKALGARPVWFAMTCPRVEVDAALLAHAQALRRAHRLLLIVQPRDPTPAEAIAHLARDAGFVCARRTLEEEITETTQVYIADTDDDPGLFLRLAPVSYLGGSLTEGTRAPPRRDGAALGSALVFGPHADAGPGAASTTLLQPDGRAVRHRPRRRSGRGGRRICWCLKSAPRSALRAWSFGDRGQRSHRGRRPRDLRLDAALNGGRR